MVQHMLLHLDLESGLNMGGGHGNRQVIGTLAGCNPVSIGAHKGVRDMVKTLDERGQHKNRSKITAVQACAHASFK
eukprot:1020628-Pelagomonas_calceolata.AAC.2